MGLVKETKLSKIIKIRNLKKEIKQHNRTITILPTCSLSIDDGDMVAITGQSGVGKSTLLNIIGCLDQPSSGHYYLNQSDITDLSCTQRSHLRKETFGYIFQQYWLINHLTVIENVELALYYASGFHHSNRQKALDALDQLGILSHAQHYPCQLSGGQQQRASIARAIITKPNILIADEPTGALDHENSMQIMQILKEIHRSYGTTLILVTHDREIAGMCNKRLPMETLFTEKEQLYAQA